MSLIDNLNGFFGNVNFDIDNTVMVCGAGISADSNLPLGIELIERIYKDFGLEDLSDFYKTISNEVYSKVLDQYDTRFFNYPRLEVLYDGIRSTLTKEQYNQYVVSSLLRKTQTFGPSENCIEYELTPNVNHYIIAELIRQGTTCISFNFDELIELAYNNLYSEELKPVILPNGTFKHNSVGKFVKAHGCLSTIDNISNIGIDVQNLQVNGFTENDSIGLKAALNKCENIILIGYSFSDTLDFIPFLTSAFEFDKIRFYFLNFSNDLEVPVEMQIIQFDNQVSGHFQFDFYLSKISKKLHVLKYNPKLLFKKNAIYVPNVAKSRYQCDTPILNSVLEDYDLKCLIKLNVLKNLGLLNVFGHEEIKSLKQSPLARHPEFRQILNYQHNINADYGKNLIFELRAFFPKMSLRQYLKLFGALSEYQSLNNKKLIHNILSGILFFIIYVSLYPLSVFVSEPNLKLSILRHRYRIDYKLVNAKFLNRKVQFFFARWILNRILRCEKLALSSNNLQLYRFILKEKFRCNQLLYGNTAQSNEEFIRLFVLNADTNYFIDIANLLRIVYDMTNDNKMRNVSLVLTKLTLDRVNEEKINSLGNRHHYYKVH